MRVYRIPITKKAPARGPLPLPDKPSIAVLPFANMSGDPEQEYSAGSKRRSYLTRVYTEIWDDAASRIWSTPRDLNSCEAFSRCRGLVGAARSW